MPADYDFNGFPSLRDLWIWDNQFNKALLLSNNNSTNLASVEVFNNHFPSADFSGQTNLDHILIDGNPTLTNLIVSGCTKLKLVDASGDGLSTASVDLILSDLDLKMPSGHTIMAKQHWDDSKNEFTDLWKYTVEDAATLG